MRLFLLTFLTMLAFAANSLLTRAAVEPGHMSPQGFALLRVAAGAAVLTLLTWQRGAMRGMLSPARLPGALCLAAYMIGFSLAYRSLDAGLGALILFGVTQITMFTVATFGGTRPTARQLAGAGLAFGGLVLVLLPGPDSAADLTGAFLMAVAGIGWGLYTLLGRGAGDPLARTAGSFVLCLPMVAVALAGYGLAGDAYGIALAVISGAVTSGLGYALWYSVLPRMAAATAAVVQLCVPILAILGGALVLGETVTPLILLASALVLGGIGWAATAPRVSAPAAQADRS